MPDLMTPLDGLPWSSERFLRQAPTWAPSGVIGTPANVYGSGDMGLSFGVAGSVITVQMATGRANCRGVLYERTTSQWTSGVAGTQPTPGTAAYALNSNSNPRIDRLVLRRNAGSQQAYPFIIQGTPGVTPAKPALTQVEAGTWDTPLHSWQLAGSSSTTISNITDERVWVQPNGSGIWRPDVVAGRTADGSSPTGGFTNITWDGERLDPYGCFDGTYYTARMAGEYRVSAVLVWDANTTGARGGMTVFRALGSGSDLPVAGSAGMVSPAPSGIFTAVPLPVTRVAMAAGDRVAIAGFQNSGVLLGVKGFTSSGAQSCGLNVELVQAA